MSIVWSSWPRGPSPPVHAEALRSRGARRVAHPKVGRRPPADAAWTRRRSRGGRGSPLAGGRLSPSRLADPPRVRSLAGLACRHPACGTEQEPEVGPAQGRPGGYTLEESLGTPEDWREFEDRMVVPYARERFGADALIASPALMRALRREARILFLEQEGRRVAGACVLCRDGVAWVPILGVAGGDVETMRNGALAATYAMTVEWAKAAGMQRINLGRTGAYGSDGIARYKRKWGLTPEDDPHSPLVAVRVDESRPEPRAELSGEPGCAFSGSMTTRRTCPRPSSRRTGRGGARGSASTGSSRRPASHLCDPWMSPDSRHRRKESTGSRSTGHHGRTREARALHGPSISPSPGQALSRIRKLGPGETPSGGARERALASSSADPRTPAVECMSRTWPAPTSLLRRGSGGLLDRGVDDCVCTALAQASAGHPGPRATY